jgi:hypothetical protein
MEDAPVGFYENINNDMPEKVKMLGKGSVPYPADESSALRESECHRRTLCRGNWCRESFH